MTTSELILTALGGLLFSFFVISLWGRLVDRYRAWGGLLAAVLIVGHFWLFNHGMAHHLITQSGQVFIDMGFAVGIGTFAYGIFKRHRIGSALINLIAAVLGGCLAGALAYLIFYR